MKKLIKLGYAARVLGIKRKDVKRILFDKGIISKSEAVVYGEGLVGEILIYRTTNVSTSLRLTVEGMSMLVNHIRPLIPEEVCHE